MLIWKTVIRWSAATIPAPHQDILSRVQRAIPDEDTLYDLTELFRIFGDSTRVRILYVLFESEMCVCDIAELLGMTQSAISHQLRALKNAPSGLLPPGGENRVLRPGGRPCENHHRPGAGARAGISIPSGNSSTNIKKELFL